MLSQSRLQTIVWTADIQAATVFYRDVLQLEKKEVSDGAVVFDVGGSELRVSPVPSTRPSEHTVFGFAVGDVDQAVRHLGKRGVEFVRFANFPQDDLGILLTPDGSRVAWFRDPDGNLISVVQFAAENRSGR